ncbi:MAG: helix-turn-helix transcriptional regulator [Acidimicrobiia bacterium]|nr:helix-turn-helix transcriptional regulator [Acidimicrobiia bacterium]
MRTPGRRVSELEAEIGRHLRARRIDKGLRQTELAELADISVATLSHLEGGKGGNVTTLVKVVRALDATSWIDQLAPVTGFSPLALLDRGARATSERPRRVRARRAGRT